MAFDLGSIVSSGASGFLDGVDKILSRFIESPDKRQQALQDITTQKNRHDEFVATLAQTQYESQLKDIQSARELYKVSSSLQRIFSITFLVCYMLLTAYILYVYANGIELSSTATGFVGTIFGGMSMKVNTIVDFLFGSSKSSQAKDETISNLSK